MPFFGWSEYSLEGVMISCSVEWNKKTLSVMSYNITITVFVYLLPLATLIYTNTTIVTTVSLKSKAFCKIVKFMLGNLIAQKIKKKISFCTTIH